MAELYLCRQSGPVGFEKTVVIKRLHATFHEQPEVVEMFLDEARIAARLNHPNCVQIYDLGEAEGGYFIAMEYIDGHDLVSIQRAAKRSSRPIEPPMASYIIARVCRGLHHAHRVTGPTGEPLGLVHRDVSPHNVLVSYGGEVKLVDFGVAKANSLAAKTQAGVLKGKFAYMSPEQCQGHAVDARSDVFAAGVLLHELLTRQRLFRRTGDFATMRAVLEDPIPLPSSISPGIPQELDQAVLQALARDPAVRHQSAEAFQRALEATIRSEGWRVDSGELADYLQGLLPHEGRPPAGRPLASPPTETAQPASFGGAASGSNFGPESLPTDQHPAVGREADADAPEGATIAQVNTHNLREPFPPQEPEYAPGERLAPPPGTGDSRPRAAENADGRAHPDRDGQDLPTMQSPSAITPEVALGPSKLPEAPALSGLTSEEIAPYDEDVPTVGVILDPKHLEAMRQSFDSHDNELPTLDGALSPSWLESATQLTSRLDEGDGLADVPTVGVRVDSGLLEQIRAGVTAASAGRHGSPPGSETFGDAAPDADHANGDIAIRTAETVLHPAPALDPEDAGADYFLEDQTSQRLSGGAVDGAASLFSFDSEGEDTTESARPPTTPLDDLAGRDDQGSAEPRPPLPPFLSEPLRDSKTPVERPLGSTLPFPAPLVQPSPAGRQLDWPTAPPPSVGGAAAASGLGNVRRESPTPRAIPIVSPRASALLPPTHANGEGRRSASTFVISEPLPFDPEAIRPAERARGGVWVALAIGSVIVGLSLVASWALWGRATSGNTASLDVATTPLGARVFVDGREMPGSSPLLVPSVRANSPLWVVALKDGYASARVQLTLKPGERRVVTLRLSATGTNQQPQRIEVSTVPSGAEIFFDGTLQGRAPLVLAKVAPQRRHELLARKPGYADKTLVLAANRPPAEGRIVINLVPLHKGQGPGQGLGARATGLAP